MPWFEERSLFVGDTHIRWYEPGVGEGWVDVDSDAYGRLVPLEARGDGVVHGDRLRALYGPIRARVASLRICECITAYDCVQNAMRAMLCEITNTYHNRNVRRNLVQPHCSRVIDRPIRERETNIIYIDILPDTADFS
ncbi:hypothetical protein TcasGA2_TC001453 [Tribolium castaneum]|uniref:Uncharacterized protein n=1 Tax=Tribolium castaneum TaxID=7070 RepID=D7EII9_TRICA|nr:hypothetical protein TcasGA2_TC001453 [Tribolium castaneum]